MNAQDGQTRSRAVDRKGILRQLPLFSGLPDEIVDKVCTYAIVKDVRSGTAIFAKGEPGQSMFAVLTGIVKISAPSFEGKDTVFNFINEGGLFGEIALLDGNTRTADAIAATDCKLMRIDRRDFLPLLRVYPELATKIIEMLCMRLRHTSQQVENIAFLGLPGRLANALLRLASEREACGADPAIRITQREIGQVIGMSRESTNKQLRDWQRRKWIRLDRGGLVILQHNALKEIAHTDIDTDD